jgi:hypothetical protein
MLNSQRDEYKAEAREVRLNDSFITSLAHSADFPQPISQRVFATLSGATGSHSSGSLVVVKPNILTSGIMLEVKSNPVVTVYAGGTEVSGLHFFNETLPWQTKTI